MGYIPGRINLTLARFLDEGCSEPTLVDHLLLFFVILPVVFGGFIGVGLLLFSVMDNLTSR